MSGRTIGGIRGKYKDVEIEVRMPGEAKSAPSAPAPTAPPPVDDPQLRGEDEGLGESVFWRLQKRQLANDLPGLTKDYAAASTEIRMLDDEERELIEVLYRRLRLSLGDHTAQQELVGIHDSNPQWYRPAQLLAQNALALENYENAMKWARQALARASTFSTKGAGAALLLEIELKANGQREMLNLATALATELENDNAASAIYKWVADVLLDNDLTGPAVVLYQKAINLDPGNTDLRFSVAYATSKQTGYEFESYHHYRKLEEIAWSKSMVLNNLAFAADALGSGSLRGHYLERATRVDRPWALANVAIQLASIGLIENAENTLGQLDAEDSQNDHVVDARQYIKQVVEGRGREREGLDSAAEPKMKFLSGCAHSLMPANIKPGTRTLEGAWHFGGGSFSATAEQIVFRRTVDVNYLRPAKERTYSTRHQSYNGAFFSFTLVEQNPTLSLLSPSPITYHAHAFCEPGGDLMLLLQEKSIPQGDWKNELLTLGSLY